MLLVPLEAIRLGRDQETVEDPEKMKKHQQKDYDDSLKFQQQELAKRQAARDAALQNQMKKQQELMSEPGKDFAQAQKNHAKAIAKAKETVEAAQKDVDKQQHDLVTEPASDFQRSQKKLTKQLGAMKKDLSDLKHLLAKPGVDPDPALREHLVEKLKLGKEEVTELRERIKTEPEKVRAASQQYHEEKLYNSTQALTQATEDEFLKQMNITAGPAADFAQSIKDHTDGLNKASRTVKRAIKHEIQAQQDLYTKPMEAYNTRPKAIQEKADAKAAKKQAHMKK